MDHRYAKSALDIAFWDITAKDASMPLYQLLGGKRADSVPTYHSITCTEPQRMVVTLRVGAVGRDGLHSQAIFSSVARDGSVNLQSVQASGGTEPHDPVPAFVDGVDPEAG